LDLSSCQTYGKFAAFFCCTTTTVAHHPITSWLHQMVSNDNPQTKKKFNPTQKKKAWTFFNHPCSKLQMYVATNVILKIWDLLLPIESINAYIYVVANISTYHFPHCKQIDESHISVDSSPLQKCG
jgi:hypothetical protein